MFPSVREARGRAGAALPCRARGFSSGVVVWPTQTKRGALCCRSVVFLLQFPGKQKVPARLRSVRSFSEPRLRVGQDGACD